MRKILYTLAALAAVGLVVVNWTGETDAQTWGVGGVKTEVITDPPQGYSKYYEESLDSNTTNKRLHVSDTGYWFHQIGIAADAPIPGGYALFMIKPYSTTTDSTSIAATNITVLLTTGSTSITLPVNCYQFTTYMTSPTTATYITAKVFNAFGWQKKHN